MLIKCRLGRRVGVLVVALVLWTLVLSTLTSAADSVESLTGLLSDPDWVVRRDAALALGERGREASQSVDALTALLKDETVSVRWAAAKALGQIGSGGADALIGAMQDPDDGVRQMATRALGQVPDAGLDAVSALERRLLDDSSAVRLAAVESLKAVSTRYPQAASALGIALGDDDIKVVWNARSAMMSLGVVVDGRLVSDLLSEDDMALKLRAIKVLKVVSSASSYSGLGAAAGAVAAELVDAVRSEVPALRTAATEILTDSKAFAIRDALSASRPSSAAQVLAEAVGDADVYVRCVALRALQRMGEAAHDATAAGNASAASDVPAAGGGAAPSGIVAAIRAALADENSSVRDAAKLALASVTGEDWGSEELAYLEAKRLIIKELDGYVSTILKGQNITRDEMIDLLVAETGQSRDRVAASYTKGSYEVQPGDKMHGGFTNTNNMRQQEGTYTLAYVYQAPESRYYRSPQVLNSIIWSLDYLTRAQGINGGYNEFTSHGWCGGPVRRDGKSSVGGFTLFAVARSIILLYDKPEFSGRLGELIDSDGTGVAATVRREAYLTMLRKAGAWLAGTGRGHAPNQDVSNIAAIYEINAALRLMDPDGPPAVEEPLLNGIVKDSFSRTAWWSSQGMIKEGGGYDANYGFVTLKFLADLARWNSQAIGQLQRFSGLFQYFLYPSSTSSERSGYNVVWQVANRVRQPMGISLPAVGLAQSYHPAIQAVYRAELEKFVQKPSLGVDGSHTFQEGLYQWVMLLEFGQPPLETDYVPVTRSGEPFTYFDAESNILATRMADGHLGYVTYKDGKAIYYVVGVGTGEIPVDSFSQERAISLLEDVVTKQSR